jgi:flagellar basal body rod protein FlgG
MKRVVWAITPVTMVESVIGMKISISILDVAMKRDEWKTPRAGGTFTQTDKQTAFWLPDQQYMQLSSSDHSFYDRHHE